MITIHKATSLIFLLLLTLTSSCPSAEKLYPCTCKAAISSIITCPFLENDEALRNVVGVLKGRQKFYSFVIHNGNFINVPHDIFKGVQFQELEIRSSSFMGLTDTDVAFEGLEDYLVSLVITNSTILNEWNWLALRNLKKLIKISVDVDLEIISDDIEELNAPNLAVISFNNNKITYIYEKAFAKFSQVATLSLRNNLISEIKRSMMPNPAVLLMFLDFSHNQMQQLPTDIFENLPSLEMVNLASNHFLTLNEKTFSSVWSNLRYLDISDNPLRCDCLLSWILGMKFPAVIKAICNSPLELKGKSLTDLNEVYLWC